MPEFTKVASVGEIPDGQGKCVELNGNRVAVFNVGGQFYAIDDTCTHEDGPLSEGEVDPETMEVSCPWHNACFDLRTGEVTCPPAFEPVNAYTTRVNGDDVEVQV